MKFTNPLILSLVFYSNLRLSRAQEAPYKSCPDPPESNYEMISSFAECEEYMQLDFIFTSISETMVSENAGIKGCYPTQDFLVSGKLVFTAYDISDYYPASVCKFVAPISSGGGGKYCIGNHSTYAEEGGIVPTQLNVLLTIICTWFQYQYLLPLLYPHT